MRDDRRDQIAQLTATELGRYASQLARCLKALDTTAPIRMSVQDELTAVRAEQDTRAAASDDTRRQYDVTALTQGELERARRELAASLALARPGSPVRGPIQAHLAAIDAELAAGRPASWPGMLPRRLTPAGTQAPADGAPAGRRYHRDHRTWDY